jgi:hypothetical protein
LKTCSVCTKATEPGNRNRRLNTSILVRYIRPSGTSNILIDCGKFFYHSALRWFPTFGLVFFPSTTKELSKIDFHKIFWNTLLDFDASYMTCYFLLYCEFSLYHWLLLKMLSHFDCFIVDSTVISIIPSCVFSCQAKNT